MRNSWIHSGALVACLLISACTKVAEEDTAASAREPDPELGMVTTISPEMVKNAAGLVKTGKVYALGVITGPDTVPWPGRSYSIKTFDFGEPIGENRVTGHDDRLETHVGIGSQIDGLAHVGRDGVHYGGLKAEDFFTENGLTKLGAENIPPIATRGVLIDMAKHFGVERLAPLAGFGSEEIKAAAKAQGVSIQAGDVVLFHTGWLSMADEDPKTYIEGQPGINVDGAEYLAEIGVVAVGADSSGIETMDSGEGQFIPVHQVLLTDNGIYILETMNTKELAADGAYEFFFVLGQPRFAGSVQAVINPVAIR